VDCSAPPERRGGEAERHSRSRTGVLSARHARILEGRAEKRPGLFKERANRAGNTEFVAPDLVRGTLAKGFELLETIADPFGRATHAQGERRIIIPTVYRNEYLSGLRALTHNNQPGPITRILDFTQRYTAQVNFSTLKSTQAVLEATHAFVDPQEALDQGIRLTLPSAAEG
jgi:hypothetical protein